MCSVIKATWVTLLVLFLLVLGLSLIVQYRIRTQAITNQMVLEQIRDRLPPPDVCDECY